MKKRIKKILKKENTNPGALKQMFAVGLLSKNEFLKFMMRNGISLTEAEKELKNLLEGTQKRKFCFQ